MKNCTRDVARRYVSLERGELTPESQEILVDIISQGAKVVGAVLESLMPPPSGDSSADIAVRASMFLSVLVYAGTGLRIETVKAMVRAIEEHVQEHHGGEMLTIDQLRKMFGEHE